VSSDLKSRLIVARENAETSRQESETLRTQVDDLQVRLENMQKLLTLKDDQLAQLQDRVVTEEVMAEEVVAPAEDTTAPEAGSELVEAAADAGVSPVVVEDYRIQDVAPQIDPDALVMDTVLEAFQLFPPEVVIETVIPRDPAFLEASGKGVPVALLDRRPPPVAAVFDLLAAELEPRLNLVQQASYDQPLSLLD